MFHSSNVENKKETEGSLCTHSGNRMLELDDDVIDMNLTEDGAITSNNVTTCCNVHDVRTRMVMSDVAHAGQQCWRSLPEEGALDTSATTCFRTSVSSGV